MLLLGACTTATAPEPAISAASIRERIKVLTSDEFEGRAPASTGEAKTVAYLVGEFKKLGLAPGNPDGTYIQEVPMIGITSQLTAKFVAGGKTITPIPVNDFTASTSRATPVVTVNDSEVVFVGYGIVAPEYGWDDYKGTDVRGKTVLMLINDPPVPDPKDPTKLDPKIFGGRAMTYYGRWTYKYEIASAKGAAACIIIHETGPAGYPFAVLGGGWGREGFTLHTPDGNASRVAVEGWLTLNASKSLIAASGKDFAILKKTAARREFRPVALNATASFSVQNTVRDVASQNVMAKLEGASSAHKDEYLVYTAHWDHLGRDARLKGDQIFNGAHDNASGLAVLLELAQAFAALPPQERPKRSVLFLAVTAEEKGLLGSRYYAENPLYPLRRTVANINMDGAQFIGPSRDLEVIGYGNSTLDDLAAAILEKSGRTLTPDTEPEKGYFYRSDHFEFAKQGVPAFYTHYGVEIIGQPTGYGRKRRDEFVANDYHKVSDEIKSWWDFGGAATDTRFLFELGRMVADGQTWPEWRPDSEFKARRDATMQGK
ncbi:MAG: M28 family peptidase [Opitutaceae bacterium]|nr:M28 family peptidase [Opitutaceae bacterium]